MIRGILRVVSYIVMVSAAVLMFQGCAGDPATREQIPDWVRRTPRADDRYEYFIGSSSDYSNDLSRADQQATFALIDEITRYMGVRITTETTAEARASLDEFESSVNQQVRQAGSARIQGFQVMDRYVERRDDRVTVYILGRYERSALEAERMRLQALFQEQIDAVAIPEREGRLYERAGRYYDAAVKYIEAAHAAAGSDLENAGIQFERNIANARRAVSEIRLSKLNDNLEGMVRSPFPEEFRLVVETPSGPVPGAQVRVSYRESRGGARTIIRHQTLRADPEGVVRFQIPLPEVVGHDSVTMALDLSSYMIPLQDLDRTVQPQVDSLSDAILGRRAVFQYEVLSRAREIPTGVIILDTDIAGNPTGSGTTATGIVQELTQAGFRVQNLEFDARQLTELSDNELLELLRSRFGTKVERVIFGRVEIDEFQEADGFVVRVTGSVSAVALSSGEVLYSYSTFQRSRGSSSAGAISAAFRNIGRTFGRELASRLP